MAGWVPQPVFSRDKEVRIGVTRRIRSLPFAGLLLLALLASGALAWLPGWVRFVAAVAALAWLPGVVLTRLVSDTWRLPVTLRLPLGFLAGLSAQAIPAGILIALDARLAACSAVAQWMSALILGIGWWKFEAPPRQGRIGSPGIVAALIALSLLAFVVQSEPGFTQDGYDHIGYVRQIMDGSGSRSASVLAMPAQAPGPLAFDPRKGSFHVLMAALSSIAGLDPYKAWMYAPLVFFPLAFLAFLAFCRVFVNTRAQLFWCGAIFLVSYGSIGFFFPRVVLYGQNLTVFWYWVLAALCLVPGRCRGGTLGLAAILCAGGAMIHAGVILHAGLLAATLALFAPAFGEDRRTAFRTAMVVVGAMLPVAVWRILNAGETNYIHSHIQGVLFLTQRWFVVSPLEILRQHGLIFLGGLVLLPAALAWLRTSPVARRQLALAVVPLFICFVPLVATILYERGSYMVFRSLLNIPVYPVIVVTFAGLVVWARKGRMLRRLAAFAAMAAWGLAFVAPAVRSVAADLTVKPVESFLETNEDLIRYLRTLPAGSVIASDPKTAYALSAFTSHRFVAVYGQHANPFDPIAMERLQAVRDIFNPWSPPHTVVNSSERFAIDFLVCNGRTPTRATEFLSLWDVSFYEWAVSRFTTFDGRFRRVWQGDRAVVFLHDTAGGYGIERTAPPAPFQFAADGSGGCNVPSPQGDYRITAVTLDPDAVAPGEELAFEVVYEKARESAFGFPHVLHVRFDLDGLDRGDRYPGEKYVRRWREGRTGRAMRFRWDRIAYDSLFPPEYWPIGRDFNDRFAVNVPARASEGRYTVEVAVEIETLLPNFTIEDLLFNRDHYSGSACGTLEVANGVKGQ